MSDGKSTREQLDEIAETMREIRDNEVAEEIRRLRAEVEALRAAQAGPGLSSAHVHCNWGHCACWIVHGGFYSPTPVPYAPYWTVTSGGTVNVTSGGQGGYVVTNAAAISTGNL